MEWLVEDSLLKIKMDNGNIIIPTAADVFSIVFKSVNSLKSFPGVKVFDPGQNLPNIKFSKTGLGIKGRITCESNRSINLEFFATSNNTEVILEVTDSFIVDHVIIGDTWYHLTQNSDEVSTLMQISGLKEAGKISFTDYLALKKVLRNSNIVDIDDRAVDGLKNGESLPVDSDLRATFKGQLYPYQQRGYEWLKYMADEQCGCILGDEMGLGKTIQVLALIDWRKALREAPALVVVPVSLIENWRRELAKFTPALKVLIHRGPDRTGFYSNFLNNDVVLTSYDIAVGDLSMMKMVRWDLLVLDESQNIKNPQAARTRSIKQIPCRTAIAVSGTPFENHMTDLWSVTDFVFPGYLGSLDEFNKNIPDEVEGARIIEPLVTPLLLRRRVAEVAPDLPERIDIPQVVEMENSEAMEYEDLRHSIMEAHQKGAAQLVMLQKLRMYCAHPFIINQKAGDPAQYSGKYRRLCEIIEEIVLSGDKFIIFTSYNHMVSILLEDLQQRFLIPAWQITGATPPENRQPVIDEFTNFSGSAVLVLNPRAGGVGLNITAANHVIHYNLEWNPALEDQASARAYRRGQEKTVTVHRLFYSDTVEEVVNQRIEKKRDMFETAIVGTEGSQDDMNDIIRAINISPFRSR